MPEDDRTTERSENVDGRPETEGAPGTSRGRAGTAGTEGENVARAGRKAPKRGNDDEAGAADGRGRGGPRDERGPRGDEARHREREPATGGGEDRPELRTDEGTGATRMHGEVEGSEEGIAGEGIDESGTLPGSTGGVTGTAGHSGGEQTPGSTDPGFPGMSAEEAERRRARGRTEREEGEETA